MKELSIRSLNPTPRHDRHELSLNLNEPRCMQQATHRESLAKVFLYPLTQQYSSKMSSRRAVVKCYG